MMVQVAQYVTTLPITLLILQTPATANPAPSQAAPPVLLSTPAVPATTRLAISSTLSPPVPSALSTTARPALLCLLARPATSPMATTLMQLPSSASNARSQAVSAATRSLTAPPATQPTSTTVLRRARSARTATRTRTSSSTRQAIARLARSKAVSGAPTS